jgi:hypothetical protein
MPGHGASWSGQIVGGLVPALGLHCGSMGWPLTVSEAGPLVEDGPPPRPASWAIWR